MVTLPVIPFPTIDPVLIEIGPFAIRWYALAYIAGLLLGWRYVLRLARRPGSAVEPKQADDFLLWATLGVVLGGRLGYVLFYNPGYYLENPAQILIVWEGGMSFHGGMLGVVVALLLYARRQKLPVFALSDVVAVAAPIGLFFGRLANFINGELYGRAADVPWAMVFPTDPDSLPRHPSQLYQAALEGLLLFAALAFLAHRPNALQHRGLLTGAFLGGYAIARTVGELFRQPDAHIGFLSGGVTMGQTLSLPMLAVGLWMIWRSRQRA